MPSDPQRVQEIFIDAVLKSESERAEFLDCECADDSQLRGRVEALIKAHEQSGSFLESPPKDLAGTSPTVAQSAPEQAGSLIGPYKLLQPIGEGGMGSVYMAEQIEPVERRVALKIIKPGMDTKTVVARFEAERQALAMMDHPNIAKVLDVGTTNSGRPYFVMELVRGVPITQYCDDHLLTPRERLELFVPVCQAVQHAHQKGIIHRDIKPSNVLVAEYDDHAVPKVIDFGLAKAMEKRLTVKTMFTEFGQIVGTPDYMSPEQAKLNQMDIDTRSDIYSLGVLLYELLSGNTPFDRQRLRSAAFDELLRIIREEEPPKPSQRLSTVDTLPSIAANRHITPAELTRQLSGELDWIVMKSIEKDRSRRYETANGLAADLRRYLADEAVEACPPSAAYQFRKFARRNRTVIVAGSLILATLLFGVLATTWQSIRASNAASRASKAEQLAHQRYEAEKDARREAETSRQEEIKQREAANARTEALRRQDYVHRVDLAHRSIVSQDIARGLELLEGCPTDLRGWEWEYVKRQAHLDVATFQVPDGESVNCVAFSPDGHLLACGSGPFAEGFAPGGSVTVRELTTGDEVWSKEAGADGVRSVAFSPDSRLLAWHNDKDFVVCDARTGDEEYRHRSTDSAVMPVALDFRADGRHLLAGFGRFGKNDVGYAKVFDVDTGEEVHHIPGHRAGVWSARFSPDGLQVAITGEGVVELWNLETGQSDFIFSGHKGFVYTVAYSPDGRLVASGGLDHTVKLWDPQTGEVKRIFHHDGFVRGVAFSPDGTWLATASETQRVKLWSVDSDRQPISFNGHTFHVTCVAFSPDGQFIASSAFDRSVKLWSATGQTQLTVPPDGGFQWVRFTSNGRWIVVKTEAFGRNHVRLIDSATGEEQTYFAESEGWGPGFAISPDGRFAASGSGPRISIWEFDTGKRVHTLEGSVGWVTCIAYSPDAAYLASGTGKGAVVVWDVESNQQLHVLEGHTSRVNAMQFSPCGKFVATAGKDKSVRIWNVERGTILHTLSGHRGEVLGLGFEPLGRNLVTTGGVQGEFGEVFVWDWRLGNRIAVLPDQTKSVYSVSYSPDGKRIVTTCDDHTLRFWDSSTFQDLFTLRGHTAGVLSADFSPDGRRLASGSIDQTIRVWDLDRPNLSQLLKREALTVIKPRFDALRDRAKVLQSLREDSSLSPAVSSEALRLAEHFHEHPSWRLYYAQLYEEEGNWEQAAREYARAVEQNAPQAADALQALARRYISLGRNAEALVQLARLVDADPGNAELWHQRGEFLYQLSRHDEAIESYTRALELDPVNTWAHNNRGNCYKQLGQFAKALSDYQMARKLGFKDTAELYRNITHCFQKLGRTDELIAELDELVKSGPDNAALWHLRGDCLSQLSRHDQAIESYTRALELKPDHYWARLNRGRSRFKLGQRDPALDDYLATLDLENENVLFVFMRGERLLQLHEFERALTEFQKAIQLHPESATDRDTGKLYRNMALCFQQLGRTDELIVVLDKLVKSDPDDAEMWHQRGEFLYQLSRHDQAIESYTRALELKPDHYWARLNRGRSRFQLGQRDPALDDYLATLDLENVNANFVFNRGEHLLQLGLAEQALDDFERAIVLVPNKTHYRKRAAFAHFKLGQFEEALRDLEVRVNDAPDDTSTIIWIPPAMVAKCQDESFKSGLISLADQLVDRNDQKGKALTFRSQLLVALGDHKRALLDLEQATEHFSQAAPSFDECYQRYTAAMLCLQLGENEKYRQSVHAMQQRFAATEDANSQNFVGWTACLAPDAVEGYSTLLALAERAVAADPENDQYQTTLAGLRFRAGEHELARDLLLEIARRDRNLNSSPVYGWYFLAMTQQALGNADDAKTYLAKANDWTIRIFSDAVNPPAWNRKLTLELLRDEAEQSLGLNASDRDELIAAYYSGPPPADATVEYWNNRALWHNTKGQHGEAAEAASQAIVIDPGEAFAHEQRAWAYLELGRIDEAINDVNDAIRIDPGFVWAYIRRSQAYRDAGQLDLALEDAEQAIALDAENCWGWFQLGLTCGRLKEWTKAAEAHERFLHFEPDHAGGWSIYSKALVASGQLTKYRDYCAKLLERHGQTDDPKIARELTNRLLIGPDAVDDWTLPLRLSQLVLNSGNGDHRATSHVSELLCRAGEYERSLEMRAAAIAAAGREPHAWDFFWQAMANHGLGNIDQAKELASKARELADSGRLGANNHDVFEMLFTELTGKLKESAVPPSKEDEKEIAKQEQP